MSSRVDRFLNEKNAISKSVKLQRALMLQLVSLCVLSVLIISACGEKPLPSGEKEFAEGLLALELGDTTAAQASFIAAEQNDPARPWRRFAEARRIELYSSPFGAMRIYLEVMSLAPDFDSAYTGYCRIALSHGKTNLAWNALQSYAANRNLNVNKSSGPTSGAERNYDMILAKILQTRGETVNAESKLLNLSNAFPNDGEVSVALAQVLLHQGRLDEALAFVESALNNDGDRRVVIEEAIGFYTAAGYADKATSLLQEVREAHDPNNIWANRLAIKTFRRLGYPEYAGFTVSQMKSAELPAGLAYFLNAEQAEARGDFVQAKEWYLYSLSQEHENIELFRDAARAATGANNFIWMEDNMNDDILKLEKLNYPREYLDDAHLQFAEFYAALLQWRPALVEMQRAEATFSGAPRFELLKARILYLMQDQVRASDLLTKLAARNNKSFLWRRGLAFTYLQLNNADSATTYLQKALEMRPNDIVSLVLSVNLARKGVDTAGYAKAVEKLIQTYPRNKSALRAHADYFLSVGDLVSALDVSNRMIELYPGDLSAYDNAALLAGSRYGAEQGLKYLTDAKEKNPSIPAPYRKLSSYYLRGGAIDSGEIYWSKAFQLDPSDEATLLTRGVLYEGQSFPDSAIAVYKQIIELNPFSAEAYNNLAWVMANNDLELAQAGSFAREGVALSGGVNGNMHGTHAWVLFKEKKYKQANMSMQLATRFDPQDPFKRYMSGTILEAWGKNEEAVEQFQQALDLGISGGYRKTTEDAIARLKS